MMNYESTTIKDNKKTTAKDKERQNGSTITNLGDDKRVKQGARKQLL